MPRVWLYGIVYMSRRLSGKLLEARVLVSIDGRRELKAECRGVKSLVLEEEFMFRKEVRVVGVGPGYRESYTFIPAEKKNTYIVEFPFFAHSTLRVLIEGRIREAKERLRPQDLSMLTKLLSGRLPDDL